MPALPVVPNVIKVNVQWTDEGDPMAQTIHYFRYSGGPPSSANCASMAAAMVGYGSIDVAPVCLGSVGMNSAEVTDLASATGGQGTSGTPWLGTLTGTRHAPGSSYLVLHKIGRRYRGGKPRTYWPVGKAEDITAAGLWSSASAANVSAAWGSWVADVLTTGVGCTLTQIVNVSYFKGFTVVTNPMTGRARNVPTVRASPVVDNILSHTVDQKIGSQRRRNQNA
jgi:hypothetical protein